MRSAKLVVLLLLIGLVTVVVWQNVSVFTEKKELGIDLWVWQGATQPIPLAVYFLGFFFIGLLAAYLATLKDRFKAKRMVQGHLQTIRRQEEELNALKDMSAQGETQDQPESERV
jgi:small-conductance mechanosensitive channel